MLAILITLDCVRADVLDENSGLTPCLDALAPEWTTFTQAFAQSQNTLSSHLSMLTSNYLFQHGVYSNFSQKALPEHAPDSVDRVERLAITSLQGLAIEQALEGKRAAHARDRKALIEILTTLLHCET